MSHSDYIKTFQFNCQLIGLIVLIIIEDSHDPISLIHQWMNAHNVDETEVSQSLTFGLVKSLVLGGERGQWAGRRR